MDLNFDEIPSKTEINAEKIADEPTSVVEELESARRLLEERILQCEPIKPIFKRRRHPSYKIAYKLFCLCSRYNPQYCCNHEANVIIDRDVLTKEEHICHLATPKHHFGANRGMVRMFHKRIAVPGCTSRIDQLAKPDKKRVRDTLQFFEHVLNRRQCRTLQKHLQPQPNIQYIDLDTAFSYLQEEQRLLRVQKRAQARRCAKIQKKILEANRQKIRRIVCLLFADMKSFLMNDQFQVDEKSALNAVILEQIREFTDTDFYTTSNLRDFQQVLANNLTVWINKFIANLNIRISPAIHKREEHPEPETFLPISDHISISDQVISEDNYYGEMNFGEELTERAVTLGVAE